MTYIAKDKELTIARKSKRAFLIRHFYRSINVSQLDLTDTAEIEGIFKVKIRLIIEDGDSWLEDTQRNHTTHSARLHRRIWAKRGAAEFARRKGKL